jgi:peptidyl-tRNA hydrolase
MNHYNVKQVIITRADLNYGTKGKFASMVAHASVASLLKYFERGMDRYLGDHDEHSVQYEGFVPEYVDQWIQGDFAKITLKTDTLESLLALEAKAKELHIPSSLITDNGTTVFDGPTIVSLAIGPWASDKIDEITKDLKLA